MGRARPDHPGAGVTPGGTGVLGAMTWPDVAQRCAGSLLVVPLGATEQHGPHLPLATDTEVARALADGLASRRAGVLVAPALPYGSSGEHAAFAGTISIGADALERVVVELVRSADAFSGVVLVSGHGGNTVPLARAVQVLEDEGRSVLAWSPRADLLGAAARMSGWGDPDAHAGWVETSLLLCIRPDAVRTERSEAGDLRPLGDIADELRRHGVGAVSPNGVLGDPRQADLARGQAILQLLVDDLHGSVAHRFGAAS